MAYVNYDRKSKITVQKQSTDYNCAKTCLAMCLNVSINTVMNSFPEIMFPVGMRLPKHMVQAES